MRKNTKNNGFPGNICPYFPSWIFVFIKFDDKKKPSEILKALILFC